MNDGVGRFHEKDRRCPLGIVPHLAGVRRVVAADTINPVHGKYLVSIGNGNGRSRYVKQIHSKSLFHSQEAD